MHSKSLLRLATSGGARSFSRSALVRPTKLVPLVKLHDLLDTKAAEPDALVANFKALHHKGVRLPMFFYEKAVDLLCQRHDSVRVEYLLQLSRKETLPPESQLLSRPDHDSFEILSSLAIGMLARYGATSKSVNLWKNLATADFVANRKSLELILNQLARSKTVPSLELSFNLLKVLRSNGWADSERCLHDLLKILTIHLRTGCETQADVNAALAHAKELATEVSKLGYVSLTLQQAKATSAIAAAQAARRVRAVSVDQACYDTAQQAFHDMLTAIQKPMPGPESNPRRPSMLGSIFQTEEYASTFRSTPSGTEDDIASLLEQPHEATTALQSTQAPTTPQEQLFGSMVLGKERQELFQSVRRIAEAFCCEHAIRGNKDTAVADLVRCMSAFPHLPEVSPLARVAGVGARPGSPAFGFRSLFATSFAEVLAAYQPQNAGTLHSEDVIADIGGFARALLDTMKTEHITPTADFHAAWIRALPAAGEVSVAAMQEVVNDAHPAIRSSVQMLDAQVDFYCKLGDHAMLQRALSLYKQSANEGVKSISAMTRLIMSTLTSQGADMLSGLLADAAREVERNQWTNARLSEMGDFLLAQLYGHARLREGYHSLRILTRLQRLVAASKAETEQLSLQHQPRHAFTVPRKAYQWTLTALTMTDASTDEEKGIESNPTGTCEWILQDMLKHGHVCDAQIAASMIKLHARYCQRQSAAKRTQAFKQLTQFYEHLKHGVLNHPPLGDDLVLVKELIRAALACEFEDAAKRMLEQRQQAGVVQVELFEPLFFYYAAVKQSLNESEDLLTQLTNSGRKPTPAIVDAMAEGYAKAGEIGAAIDWFQESLAQYQVGGTPKGFLRVLDILLEKGDADQARRGVGLIPSLFGAVDSVPHEESRIVAMYPQLPDVRKGRLMVADLAPPTRAQLTQHHLEQRFKRFGFSL